jgi:hypothetical protein
MRGMAAVLCVVLLLTTSGCAVVAVGAVAGAAAGTTYTVLGTASKTFTADYGAVLAALKQALVMLDVKTGQETQQEEGGKVVKTEIEAFARDLIISISVERLTDRATRVVVDASRDYVFKDSATATEIMNQTAANLAKKS